MDSTNTKEYKLNHDGNASRIIDLFGHLIRYDPAAKTWIIWKGKRWVTERKDKDAIGLEIMEYARQLANKVLPNLSVKYAVSDAPKSQAIAKWSEVSQRELFATINHVRGRALALQSPI